MHLAMPPKWRCGRFKFAAFFFRQSLATRKKERWNMTTGTIKAIQKQIITKLEAGEDVSELTRRLAEERAKIAAQAEVEDLKKIAYERQALRDKAEAVKAKVQKQSDAIDAFLKAKDSLVSQLQPLLEPMSELAKMAAPSWARDPGECYIFNDLGQFAATVDRIPKGYLPAYFGCPFLEIIGGKVDARDKASEAYTYLQWAYGILASLQKGISTLPLRPVEGLLAIDNETTEIELNCRVCNHEKVAEINKALQNSRSLRDIETEFNVSRSTLSRHKNNCLNLGAVRMRE